MPESRLLFTAFHFRLKWDSINIGWESGRRSRCFRFPTVQKRIKSWNGDVRIAFRDSAPKRNADNGYRGIVRLGRMQIKP